MYCQNINLELSLQNILPTVFFDYVEIKEVKVEKDVEWQDLLLNVASRSCENSFRKLFNHFYPNIIEDGGDMPSIYMKDIHLKQLTKFYEVIARKLNIRNGVIKGDLVIHDGQLYIIEFALRLSGGNFSTICIPNSSHHDIIKYATMMHLNLPIDKIELNNERKNDFISMRYKFLEESNIKPNQKIKDIISKVKMDEIIYTNMHYGKGSIIPDRTTDHSKRLGFVITKGNSREDAIDKANKYLEDLEIIIE